MCTGSPKAPPPPARVPEAPRAPDESGATGTSDRDKKRRRASSGAGSTSTILTSSRGVTDGGTGAQKTLLGQ